MRTASGDSAGTAASPRPFLPPARTPLYERPVEWMWWVLWWLPEHWRGEMITFLAAQVMALLGFLATRAGLHGEDPSRYPRLLRPVVAAFADRSAAAHVADEEEVVSLRQEVATLTRQMATLKRSLREQEQARAAMEERVKALNVKPTLTEAQRAEMEALLRDLLAALGET